MRTFIWIPLFLFAFSAFAQTPDWKWQNPLPQGNNLNDVQFVDSETGWAVGSFGTILKTRNSGQSWETQASGTQKTFKSVYFPNAQTGWVVGQKGTILKTSNGGQSWQSQNSHTTMALHSVYFSNGQNGWAVGDSCIILKTTDGGNNWQKQVTGTTFYGHTSVHFIDSQTGWVVGNNGMIFKTIDGGQSWQSQPSGVTVWLFSVYFADSQTGWVGADSGKILKTTNGGQSWQIQNGGTSGSINCIFFTDLQNGCAGMGYGGQIIRTTNGGTTWQTVSSNPNLFILSIHFTDSQTGWAVGGFGTIIKTTNGGQSWQAYSNSTSTTLFDIHFPDAQTGYAVGENGTIMKTTNSGQNWHILNSRTADRFYSVFFTDAQTGWISSSDTIRKTTDGGQNWQKQLSSAIVGESSIFFTDSQTGWVVGWNGKILKTTNGGQNWVSQNTGTTIDNRSVIFVDSQTGWIAGDSGTILKTINGGQSWLPKNSGTTSDLKSVYFINTQKGWAAGADGEIMRTNDGGQTWQAYNAGTGQTIESIFFPDAQRGWAVGGNFIMKTDNGGLSWQNQDSEFWLYAVYFTDSLRGWATGGGASIVTTVTNNYTDPETPTSLIQGKLFEKTGSGCSTSSVPVSHRLVKATPGPYYGISNTVGNYDLRLPIGNSPINYSLSAVPFSSQAFQTNAVCPSNNVYNLTLDTLSDTLSGKDFGYQIPQCHHLDVQLASNRRRRCFRNSTSVSYTNQGSVVAPDAYILVEFPHWVRGISASAPFTVLNDSVWKFETGSVQAGMGGQFTITDSVICGFPDIRNLSQCTRATIFPPPDCPPPGSWNGADLAIFGICDSGLVHLSIRNKGTGNMTDSTDFSVLMDSILVKSGKVKLAAGDSLVMVVQPQNTAVTLSVNQVANHPTEIFVTTTLEGCGNLSLTNPLASVNHFPKSQTARSKTHCLPILDSYDPNDKQAFPIGFTSNHVVKPDTEMEYLLRFQNTGNDTAYSVLVIDTLDTYLNVESLEIGAISHTSQATVQTTKSGQTILRFRFDQINLPDSTTNEAQSHGFVQFRISPKPDLAMGTQVINRADLYFDLNPGVRTNQTLTTFDELVFTNPRLDTNVHIITASKPMDHQKNTVQVFPNPANETVTIESQEDVLKISLVDALGRALVVPASGPNRLDIRQLKSGMYWLKIQTREGVVMKRLLKN